VSDVMTGTYEELRHWWYDVMKIIPRNQNMDYDKYPYRELTDKMTFKDQVDAGIGACRKLDQDPEFALYYMKYDRRSKKNADEIDEIELIVINQRVKII